MPAAPHALLEIAVTPAPTASRETLIAALESLSEPNVTLGLSADPERGLLILGVGSEEQLDRAVSLLTAERLVSAVGQPQVAFRETIGRSAEITHTHKNAIGSAGEFAKLTLLFEPAEANAGYRFFSKIADESLPAAFIPGVERGLQAARMEGLLACFPVIDFSATLTHGAYHDLDSSARTFEIAARAAFGELRIRGEPKLVEPIMRVEVGVPHDFEQDVVNDITRDLESRRGVVQGLEVQDGRRLFVSLAPLVNLLGYANSLASITQGRASVQIEFERYDEVPTVPGGDFPSSMALRA